MHLQQYIYHQHIFVLERMGIHYLLCIVLFHIVFPFHKESQYIYQRIGLNYRKIPLGIHSYSYILLVLHLHNILDHIFDQIYILIVHKCIFLL